MSRMYELIANRPALQVVRSREAALVAAWRSRSPLRKASFDVEPFSGRPAVNQPLDFCRMVVEKSQCAHLLRRRGI